MKIDVEAVRAFLARKGRSVEQLARASDIAPRTLYYALAGRSISATSLWALAKGMGLEAHRLLANGKETPPDGRVLHHEHLAAARTEGITANDLNSLFMNAERYFFLHNLWHVIALLEADSIVLRTLERRLTDVKSLVGEFYIADTSKQNYALDARAEELCLTRTEVVEKTDASKYAIEKLRKKSAFSGRVRIREFSGYPSFSCYACDEYGWFGSRSDKLQFAIRNHHAALFGKQIHQLVRSIRHQQREVQ